MIELIREKANKLEDDLWKLAKDIYGLERNRETLRRVHATIGRVLDAEAKELGVPISITEKPDQSVDDGLALAFLAVGFAREEETPDQDFGCARGQSSCACHWGFPELTVFTIPVL